MATEAFEELALEFVLTDDENAQRDLAQQAAREIQRSHASSPVTLNWIASIKPWMEANDGDDPAGKDIRRAKALDFIATTLQALDRAVLCADQVSLMVAFFRSTFSNDHKAAIAAATKALQQLSTMQHFPPEMGVNMVQDICNLGDDFQLQPAQTRLGVYDLLLGLVQAPAVLTQLQLIQDGSWAYTNGISFYMHGFRFVSALCRMFKHEKDPHNLIRWFKILPILLSRLPLGEGYVREAFDTFSVYFPISLRTPTTNGENTVTADDLKVALRGCFAAHHSLAGSTFPFLLTKLSSRDDVLLKLSAKLDILRTLKACIESYAEPVDSLARYSNDLWQSLKSHIRIEDPVGEEKDTVEPVLDVLRAIADKLDQCDMRGDDQAGGTLKQFLDLVLGDCYVDLANPIYTSQMGLVAKTVVMATPLTYALKSARLVKVICQNLRTPKSQKHKADLLGLLNSVLRGRAELMEKGRADMRPAGQYSLRGEPHGYLESLVHSAYEPALETIRSKWAAEQRDGATETPWSEEKSILCEIYRGLGLLVRQTVLRSDGTTALLCSAGTCTNITGLLLPYLLQDLSPDNSDIPHKIATLSSDNCLVEAFSTVAASFPEAFGMLLEDASSAMKGQQWVGASEESLAALATLLGRLAFIGCSQIPLDVAINGLSEERPAYSPIQHFALLQRALFQLFDTLPEAGIRPREATRHVVAGMHGAMLVFRDACAKKQEAESVESVAARGVTEFDFLALKPGHWVHSLLLDKPDNLRNHFGTPVIAEDCAAVWGEAVGISALMLQELYARASRDHMLELPIRAQIGNFAGTVVRYLDEKSQIDLNLAETASVSFRAWPRPPQPGDHAPLSHGAEYLTLGILEGLWPGAMRALYEPGGLAEGLILFPGHHYHHAPTLHQVRGAVGALVANKYHEDPESPDTSTAYVHKMINAYGDFIRSAVSSSPGPASSEFEALFVTAMRAVAGAAARLHKTVLELVPALHEAMASGTACGEIVARCLGVLVDIDYCPLEPERASAKGKMGIFRPANHTVIIKPLFKQWLYNHLVKPLYERAGLHVTGGLANFSTAILSFVVHCPFGVWSDDLEAVVRSALLAIRERAEPNDKEFAIMAKALQILHAIPEAEADDALGGHVAAVVDGATWAYVAANLGGHVSGAGRKECRTRALGLLEVLPARIDHIRLVPHVPQMYQFLADACGGRSRELRQLALRAKRNWEEVVW